MLKNILKHYNKYLCESSLESIYSFKSYLKLQQNMILLDKLL